MNSLNQLEKLWEEHHNKLETDIELFRIHFILTKGCGCSWEHSACKHFKKERDRLFGKKIDSLFKMRLMIGALTDFEVMNPKS